MNPVPAWALQKVIISSSIASDCMHAQLSWTKRIPRSSTLHDHSMLIAVSNCFAVVTLEWHHQQRMWEQGQTTLGFLFCGFPVPFWAHYSSTPFIPPPPMHILYSWDRFVPPFIAVNWWRLKASQWIPGHCQTLFLVVVITPHIQNCQPWMSSIGSVDLKSHTTFDSGCLFLLHFLLSADNTCYILATGTMLVVIAKLSILFSIATASGWPKTKLSSLSANVGTFMVSCQRQLMPYLPLFTPSPVKVWLCQGHCCCHCYFAEIGQRWWWRFYTLCALKS